MNIKDNFDKFIWRFNGVGILIICTGVMLLGGFASTAYVINSFSKPEKHDLVNVNTNTQEEEYLILGSFYSLKGTNLILIPLYKRVDSFKGYSSDPGYRNSKNYLVMNTQTKESKWVWENHSRQIFEYEEIYKSIKDNESREHRGLVFGYVDNDSNNDQKLNEDDKRMIIYFDPNTGKKTNIGDDVDRVIGISQVSDNEVFFFYVREGKNLTRSLKFPSLNLTNEKEIRL